MPSEPPLQPLSKSFCGMNACPVVRCHPLSDTATTFPSWAVPTFESPSQLGLLTSDISSQAGTQRALYLRVQPLLPVTCMQFCFNGTGSSGFQGRAGDMGIYLCDHREAITRVGGEDFAERLLWGPPHPCQSSLTLFCKEGQTHWYSG